MGIYREGKELPDHLPQKIGRKKGSSVTNTPSLRHLKKEGSKKERKERFSTYQGLKEPAFVDPIPSDGKAGKNEGADLGQQARSS